MEITDARAGRDDTDQPQLADVEPSLSLQETFQAMVASRRSQHAKTARLPRGIAAKRRKLRKVFLETALRFTGVPYARRHHSSDKTCECEGCHLSGRQLGQDMLFLDCCGLVRKTLREMAPLLGFTLGRWNQAYQFDTLPIRVSSVTELEPGDLIFYSGTLLEADAKRHPFDMTHVEIYMGGAATLGSREKYKWVMQYDNFEFVSTRWSLQQHWFVKIDTWLDGICKPAHPKLWAAKHAAGERAKFATDSSTTHDNGWDATKFSIFAADSEGDEHTEGSSAVQQDDVLSV